MTSSLLNLDNPVQNYAWGSLTAIAELLGRPSPTGDPEAELWIGAHPSAPSRIAEPGRSGTLLDAIQAEPVALLGAQVTAQFGNELPFLLKVLAAAEPLSIQCHPNRDQARQGWERENELGIPLAAPHRNYRDPNHKPELVCAVTRFVALKGFRPADEIVRNLREIRLDDLKQELSRLERSRDAAAVRALFAALMTLDGEEKSQVLKRAVSAARRRRGTNAAHDWVLRLHAKYPGDIGVLSPLYLNLVELERDEALFLPAGELHAYLEGVALEIMANSDNVLRGGLTPKHVDVPELLAVLTFEARAPEVLRPELVSPAERRYRTPAREFDLALIGVVAGSPFASPPGRGVEILLGLEGDAVVTAGARSWSLARGRSVFVPAAVGAYRIEGEGRLCRAGVPR